MINMFSFKQEPTKQKFGESEIGVNLEGKPFVHHAERGGDKMLPLLDEFVKHRNKVFTIHILFRYCSCILI